jgi:hypothetical protein
MAFESIGDEARDWQLGNSNNRCDSGKGRETRAELERIS